MMAKGEDGQVANAGGAQDGADIEMMD